MELLPQLLLNALIAGSIYALLSVGMSLSFGILRVLDFAHGQVLMLGAFCGYYLLVVQQLPLALVAMLSFAFALLYSAVILNVVILPFLRLNYLLVLFTTIALAHAIEALVSMAFGASVRSLPAGPAAEAFSWGSVFLSPLQLVVLASAVVLLSLLGLFVHRTPLGRQLRALREHKEASQSLGISWYRMSYLVFGISSVLTMFTGILVGFEMNMTPSMGEQYTIKAFAAMTLGGLGNIWGTVLGAYLLGLLENLATGLDLGEFSIPAGYKDAFAYVMILLVLLFRPQGLLKKVGRGV